MATILEALRNSEYNLKNGVLPIQTKIGLKQLNNSIILLEKGYKIYDDIEELLEKYGSIDNIPDYE